MPNGADPIDCTGLTATDTCTQCYLAFSPPTTLCLTPKLTHGDLRHSADDFKPQSIDYSQPGKLNIEKNRVQVRLQGTEDKEYVFKGNATDAKVRQLRHHF